MARLERDWVVFASLAAAAIAFGLVLAGGWKTYSLATAALIVLLIIVFRFAWERDTPRMGLLQRLMVLVGWTWIALLCMSLLSP